jgi:hypothetical protein
MLLLPALLNAVQIVVFGIMYKSIAQVLTNYENYKTMNDHNSALFKKLCGFYVINYYATLFYIAFVKGDTKEGCTGYAPLFERTEYCGMELSLQVAMVFLVNDFAWRMCTS